MAKLYFRYGSMGASKSTNCIMVAYNYKERGQNVVIFKSAVDTRSHTGFIESRTGMKWPCVDFTADYRFSIESVKASAGMDRISCILIDEAQFLTEEQVLQLSDIVDYAGIPVICYGLRTDFRCEFFPGSSALMRYADELEEIPTICWCGRKARLIARIAGGKMVKTGTQIQIGGNESYISLCRRHWKEEKLG